MTRRLPMRSTAAAALVIAGGFTLLPATLAQAETRSGDVTVTIPSRIVIDGTPIQASVNSERLYSSLDMVDFTLYTNDRFETTKEVQPNTTVSISTRDLKPGSIIGKADLATTECSSSSSDPCHLRESDLYYYEFVNGLTYHDSTAAVAKYGSRVTLEGTRRKTSVVWSATVERYKAGEWVAFRGAAVLIGSHHAVADTHGLASWTERTRARHRYTATVAETSAIWPSTSAAVRASASRPAAKTHVSSSSSATAVGTSMRARIPSITRVRGLTRSTDPNHLLGRPNGYSSAAVLYDSRTRCSDGPGADCGATIERWPSAAKAKARSKYILTILHRLPALGTEHHTIEGRFLLRVTGALTPKQARTYASTFRGLL